MKVAVVLGAVAALSAAPGAAGQSSFTDPVGDQVPFEDLVAPDITRVEVSNTPAGVITFRVTIANAPILPPNSRIAVLLDTDRDFSTGDSGFEYAASHGVDATGRERLVFERWDEQVFQMVELSTDGLSSVYASGSYTLTLPRSRIGNPTAFDFGLYAALFHPTRTNRAAVDSAPNTNIWTYALVGLPPPRLRSSALVAIPQRPVAGRPFTVGTTITRADNGATVGATTGRVRCRARVGGTPLRARGTFAERGARCLMSIPAPARGKILTGALTVRSAGAVVTKRFSFRVR